MEEEIKNALSPEQREEYDIWKNTLEEMKLPDSYSQEQAIDAKFYFVGLVEAIKKWERGESETVFGEKININKLTEEDKAQYIEAKNQYISEHEQVEQFINPDLKKAVKAKLAAKTVKNPTNKLPEKGNVKKLTNKFQAMIDNANKEKSANKGGHSR